MKKKRHSSEVSYQAQDEIVIYVELQHEPLLVTSVPFSKARVLALSLTPGTSKDGLLAKKLTGFNVNRTCSTGILK